MKFSTREQKITELIACITLWLNDCSNGELDDLLQGSTYPLKVKRWVEQDSEEPSCTT